MQDLRQEECEILEDGRPQKIETFEHIVVRTGGAQTERIEPNTVVESRSAAAEARARVFVIFLDFNHVDVAGSHDIRQPVIDMLDRAIGNDDLVAVMTPEMSASQITFARRTATIEEMLSRYWTWGERDQAVSKDPIEDQYRACYPGLGPTINCPDDDRGVADEMIVRRREKQTLDALRDLVRYLRTVREERKAILAISDGWLLYRRTDALARRLYCQAPTGAPVGIDPGTGKLTTRPREGAGRSGTCDGDRMALSQLDDERYFRDILEDANRSNCTFYPVDPRGLAVFDSSLAEHRTGNPVPGSTTIVPAATDLPNLRNRINSLRTLAEATDGVAVVDTNDLRGALTRIAGDMTSYYLLGYYSNGRLDGKFHSITVRVKRPGVQVRARRGYRALTPETGAPPVATPAVDPAMARFNAAVASLSAIRRDASIHFRVGYGYDLASLHLAAARTAGGPTIWVAGEVDAERSLAREWDGGGTVDVTVARGATTISTVQQKLAPGTRSLFVRLPPDVAVDPGDYVVRIDARPLEATVASETVRLTVPPPAPPAPGDVLLYRRGPFSGPTWRPAADPRFRRQERIRVEMPVATLDGTPTVRLLDRKGLPLQVPIAPAIQTDRGSGRGERGAAIQMVVSELALAPLAAGDYVIEVGVTENGHQHTVLVPFRILAQ